LQMSLEDRIDIQTIGCFVRKQATRESFYFVEAKKYRHE
jgi:hypothetical protein